MKIVFIIIVIVVIICALGSYLLSEPVSIEEEYQD
jgi:hypothetical protein